MNKLKQISFKTLAFYLFLICIGAYGQKQTKTYNESFKVTEETELDINTSHADIEFETWEKPEISIQATVEIEGVSDEEAEQYFENGGFEIVGNSKEVRITTTTENEWFFRHKFSGMENFDFNFEIPEIEPFVVEIPEVFEYPELMEIPPMPPIPPQEFDYEAFKKDGEKYLKKWQKEFSKGFNKEYEQKLEEWSKRMEEKGEKLEEKRKKMQEKRMEAREKLLEKRAELSEKRAKQMEKHMENRIKSKIYSIYQKDGVDSILTHNGHMPSNNFYFSSDGENKNYKVKRKIKIRMPKATKIKMNVRHGEVKLAENTQNINATVAYTSLWATTIDGHETTIKASYSPVSVQKWNYGQLQVNYSDQVDLKEVLNLRLSATSSDVVIDKLLKTAIIKNDLGPLRINFVSKDFKELDVSLQNAEFDTSLPTSAYTFYINGTNSEFSCPEDLMLERTQNGSSFVHKGHHKNKNEDRSIVINSKYSDIVLK